MTTVLIIIAILIVAYLFAIKGRTNNPDLEKFAKYDYAHRGLHSEGVPENSLLAFEKARDAGYGSELDVHLLKDGTLAIYHDSNLKRISGVDVTLEDLTFDDLKNYKLLGTEQTIPTLNQVLEVYDGKAPLVVELKAFRKNHAELSKAVCELLDTYKGDYCIESFDPRVVMWFKNNRPDIVRGQLSQNYLKANDKLPFLTKVVLTYSLLNFLTKPDFIAYNFKHKDCVSNKICQSFWNMQMVAWTIRSEKEHKDAKQNGWISIFEKFLA